MLIGEGSSVFLYIFLYQSSGSYIYGVKIAVFLISIINDTYMIPEINID